jgi:hypothetical protein
MPIQMDVANPIRNSVTSFSALETAFAERVSSNRGNTVHFFDTFCGNFLGGQVPYVLAGAGRPIAERHREKGQIKSFKSRDHF